MASLVPHPPKNVIVLAGRIDSTSFQQAKSCYEFLRERNFPIQLVPLIPTDWEIFKGEIIDRASQLGLEAKARGIVSDVLFDSELQILGPGLLLIDIATRTYNFKDSTPIGMYQSATRTRYRRHLQSLAKTEGCCFVRMTVGQGKPSDPSQKWSELGAITLMLFERDCPKTVSRFLRLVERNVYDNCAIQMITDSFIQCEHVDCEQELIPDECFSNHHDRMGMIGFCRNLGDSHSNGITVQFYITLEQVPEFDEGVARKQAFGRVIDGMRYVKMISRLEKNESLQPLIPCGIMKIELLDTSKL